MKKKLVRDFSSDNDWNESTKRALVDYVNEAIVLVIKNDKDEALLKLIEVLDECDDFKFSDYKE